MINPVSIIVLITYDDNSEIKFLTLGLLQKEKNVVGVLEII